MKNRFGNVMIMEMRDNTFTFECYNNVPARKCWDYEGEYYVYDIAIHEGDDVVFKNLSKGGKFKMLACELVKDNTRPLIRMSEIKEMLISKYLDKNQEERAKLMGQVEKLERFETLAKVSRCSTIKLMYSGKNNE